MLFVFLRDCCAPFRVAESSAEKHLNWDAWQTTDTIVTEATSVCLRISPVIRHLRTVPVGCLLCGGPGRPAEAPGCIRLLWHPACKSHQAAYREHCRIKIPPPGTLIQRVEGVLKHFHLTTDPNGIPLYKPSMLKRLRIQRVHILRGCLSDPEVEGGILYRRGGTIQLNQVPGERAAVPVWIPIRGTSQQEGYHFHQAKWVTGTQVSPELFQAQAMTGVCRWNYQRLLDLKLPGVSLPPVFNPALICSLNAVSRRVFGEEKYPALRLAAEDTGERFGLEYREPECCPVPLDWDKHITKKDPGHATSAPSPGILPDQGADPVQPSSTPPTRLFSFVHPLQTATVTTSSRVAPIPASDLDNKASVTELQPQPEPTRRLPIQCSPTAARTGPVKTGGRVFVLDHKRWPSPKKSAIDELLNKHRGHEDMIKLVVREYGTLVQQRPQQHAASNIKIAYSQIHNTQQ
uniref:uncharacterized protein LOC131127532 n=1 Tax=Doryrhamphus excisus TaxID=161450 RepID=UPI0025AE9CF8|nr:uncharacterized protein LOC131127532 [Doryrhamphus excisus]XP_057930103.1 uncharacterized protein LOC131130052 [Doryrhamphus excisus]